MPTLPAAGELQTTCIRTVGTYANWLNRNAEMLPAQLTFVSQGLSADVTAPAASQAMKHLCDACAEHLAEEATMSQLLQMYHGAPAHAHAHAACACTRTRACACACACAFAKADACACARACALACA